MVTEGLLLSAMLKAAMFVTLGMQFSIICAPEDRRSFPLMSTSTPFTLVLLPKPSNSDLQTYIK